MCDSMLAACIVPMADIAGAENTLLRSAPAFPFHILALLPETCRFATRCAVWDALMPFVLHCGRFCHACRTSHRCYQHVCAMR